MRARRVDVGGGEEGADNASLSPGKLPAASESLPLFLPLCLRVVSVPRRRGYSITEPALPCPSARTFLFPLRCRGLASGAAAAAAAQHGGVFWSKSEVTISGGLFYGNTAPDRGGVFDLGGSGHMSITGGTFRSNYGGDDGGVGFVTSSSSLEVSGGSFLDNWSDINGGGFSVETGSSLVVSTAVLGMALGAVRLGANRSPLPPGRSVADAGLGEGGRTGGIRPRVSDSLSPRSDKGKGSGDGGYDAKKMPCGDSGANFSAFPPPNPPPPYLPGPVRS